MKRSAFTLTELLVVIPVIVAAWLLFSILVPTTIRDIPHLAQTLSRHRHIRNFLTHLQNDVDTATQLPARVDSLAAGDQTLLLQTLGGVLAYEVRDGKVIRKSPAGASAKETIEWELPGALVEFHRWTRDKNNQAYAVDVHTAQTVKREGITIERFENHHVFFLHAMPPEPKTKAKS
jgi:type II secretory pathway pseudopilin PulG